MQVTPLEICDIQFVKLKYEDRKDCSLMNAIQPQQPLKSYIGPQDSPCISKERLYSVVHDCLPDACLFSIVPQPLQQKLFSNVSVQPVEPSKSTQDTTAMDCTALSDITNLQQFECPRSECISVASTGSAPTSDFIWESSTLQQLDFKPSLPPPLTKLYREEYKHLSNEALKEASKGIFISLKVSEEDSENIEWCTRSQSKCSIWHEQRCGRITASAFHDILVRKASSDPDVLVKRLIMKKDLSNIPAISWGIEHEDEAKGVYILKQTSTHENFRCTKAGLVINPQYPYLGASPDGVTHCSCCGDGLIEIKCPFSVKDGKPEDLVDRKGSFLNKVGIIKSHKYYTQIQGQLEICQRNFCDFVVWTPTGLFVQRIYKDLQFVEKLIKKLTNFYVESMLPELMTHRLQNTSDCAQSSSDSLNSSEATTEVYCICQSEEHGKMIQCENPTCKYVWFHFACVGLKRAPKGSWYCNNCITDQ